MHSWGGGMGVWGMGWIGMWFFWLIPLAVVWALLKRVSRLPTMESPEDIVKKRLARDEIDDVEYKRLLD